MLKKSQIPSSSTKIKDFTFCGCSYLFEIKIPSGVTEIGDNYEPFLNILDFSSLREPQTHDDYDDDNDEDDMDNYEAAIENSLFPYDNRYDDPDDFYFISPEEHKGVMAYKSAVYSFGKIL